MPPAALKASHSMKSYAAKKKLQTHCDTCDTSEQTRVSWTALISGGPMQVLETLCWATTSTASKDQASILRPSLCASQMPSGLPGETESTWDKESSRSLVIRCVISHELSHAPNRSPTAPKGRRTAGHGRTNIGFSNVPKGRGWPAMANSKQNIHEPNK